MGSQRRLLVVSYYYPPCPGIGGVRWSAMAHYLAGLGYDVTTATSNVWGALPDDAQNRVVRIGDLRSTRPVERLLRPLRLPRAGYVPESRPPAVLTKVIVPEPKVVTWLPAMAKVVGRLLRLEHFDCLITTSPAESTHLVGLMLRSRRPAWLADFRDGWTYEPLRERFPTSGQRSADLWMERRVAQSADVVVGATAPIAADLHQRLGARAIHVPNGWDPRDAPAARPAPRPADVVRLVHTGTLSIRDKDPTPLLSAVAAANADWDGPPIRFTHVGVLTSEHRDLVVRTGAEPYFEYLGTVERAAAIALQRSADAVVLLTSRNSSEATGKLYEYLASRRPIIALARSNEAERIVRETKTGITVPPDDVNAIVAAIRSVASGELQAAYAPVGLARYTYPGPAQEMGAAIEEAIARHRLLG